MGVARQDKGGNTFLYESPISGEYIEEEDLNYCSSFEWIIPVAEKINSILSTHNEGRFAYRLVIGPDFITIWSNDEEKEILTQKHGSTFIEMIHIALIEFIDWYNKANLNLN